MLAEPSGSAEPRLKITELEHGYLWRHVTPKDQTRDPIIFEALYLRNGAR